jgi:hypothetical protein
MWNLRHKKIKKFLKLEWNLIFFLWQLACTFASCIFNWVTRFYPAMQKVKNIFIGMFVSIRRRFEIASCTHTRSCCWVKNVNLLFAFDIGVRQTHLMKSSNIDSKNCQLKWPQRLFYQRVPWAFPCGFIINFQELLIMQTYQQPYNRFHLSRGAPYCCRISSANEKKFSLPLHYANFAIPRQFLLMNIFCRMTDISIKKSIKIHENIFMPAIAYRMHVYTFPTRKCTTSAKSVV